MAVMYWRTALAAGLLLFVSALAPVALGGSDLRFCRGQQATIVGTDGDDVLVGSVGRDVIWAGPGNDTLSAERGNDVICGGAGTDLVRGGRNNDIVDGGPGDGDRAYGDLGDDQVTGGSGDGDEVAGNLGIDLVSGGSGDNDYVHGDYGWDRMDGGSGNGDIAAFGTARAFGVFVSLPAGKARGDGRDRLFRFEGIDGSPLGDKLIGDHRANLIDGGAGDDTLNGSGGRDTLLGGQGSDTCRGGPVRRSCGREKSTGASAYVEVDPTPLGGGGLAFVGGSGPDRVTVGFEPETNTFDIAGADRISPGHGCARRNEDVTRAYCALDGPARWLIADLGPGKDRFRVRGSLDGVGQVRVAGGGGNDLLRGGPEDDLIESGRGSDRVHGGRGEDGLIGGLPGPTWLYGGPDGDLLAAGGGCAGGALVGGPGRDNASFAETQAHPGRLFISLPRGRAWIDAVKGCDPVRLSRSNEDIEGSFDNDVLIGDGRANSLLGQPGRDAFYGGGGGDWINALDRVRDIIVRCGKKGRPSGTALLDAGDPSPESCSRKRVGRPTPGLHHEH